ncbi:hypothetical protein GS416_05260 [Rhodococcus hoagii]|nr:hypothetical protein [Prescottella equi]
MPGQLRVTFARLVALCALTLGVLAMHHVTTGTLAEPTASSHHGPDMTATPHRTRAVRPTNRRPRPRSRGLPPLPRSARRGDPSPSRSGCSCGPPRTRASACPEQRDLQAGRAGRGPPFAPTTSAFLSSLCILRV